MTAKERAYIGIPTSMRGLLNVMEWRWLNQFCHVDLAMGSHASVGESCIWWNEV